MTVARMRQEMSNREFLDWQAYFAREHQLNQTRQG